jgi:peptidoglycan/LPS O-acetylase OafA/YrhL
MTKLAAYLGGRDNNLNLLRMLAASAVIVSHGFLVLSGDEWSEPLRRSTGMSLGRFAVVVFFGISGLLIARSYDRKASLGSFAIARVARLWPALTASLVLSTLVIGPLVTTLPLTTYLARPETLGFFLSNLALFKRGLFLPGVFEHNPITQIVNGSLWTLFYEVCCYSAVVLAGALGLLRRTGLFVAFAALSLILHPFIALWHPTDGLAFRIQLLGYIGYPFALGMAAYVCREKLVLGLPIVVACWLLTALTWNTWLLQTALMTASVYTALWLAFVPAGWLRTYNRLGDYSYGLYVYAYPVQQTLAHFLPGIGVAAHLLFAFAIIVPLAIASWHWIEKPALRLARH